MKKNIKNLTEVLKPFDAILYTPNKNKITLILNYSKEFPEKFGFSIPYNGTPKNLYKKIIKTLSEFDYNFYAYKCIVDLEEESPNIDEIEDICESARMLGQTCQNICRQLKKKFK